MIITRTPYRVSLLGGGTDYPAWYREHGGAVVGFAIDKYCHIFVRSLPPFFKHKHRVVYSQIELVRGIDEIDHPSVRAVLSEMHGDDAGGLEIQHMGDLPARSGLGSSSCFTVGLINALNAVAGRMSSPQQLASEAIRIEQDVIREAVGSQDQVWAAYGGLGRITFQKSGDFKYAPLIMSARRMQALNASFLLFFSGISRFASEAAAEQVSNVKSKASQLRAMRQMVDEGVDILQNESRDFEDLGRLLHESWMLKKELAAKVSNQRLDDIYSAATKAGAQGGKLLGAGGGGFMLFYAPPHAHAAIRQSLRGLIEVKFSLNAEGSSVVLYEPDHPTRFDQAAA